MIKQKPPKLYIRIERYNPFKCIWNKRPSRFKKGLINMLEAVQKRGWTGDALTKETLSFI